MPGTVNGIGTMYFGRKNASARRGTCDSCNRLTTLTSYDTREFICFVYVPLIPMTKYRILDQCASCRRHRRLSQREFGQQLDGAVQPLRETIRRSPNDPEARLALIGALSNFSMNAEAETEARAAVEAMPNDAGLNRIAGQLLSMRGDLPGAAAYLERAVQLDPTDGSARLSLGRILYLQHQFAAAVPHLAEARRILPAETAAPVLLAECYEQTNRWSEAMQLWEQIGGGQPDKSVLRRIAACKKQLGYPLSDAERRAARRWWPFGGGSRKPGKVTPVRPGAPIVRKPILILAAVVGGLMVVMAIGGVAYNMTHVDVWFDSVQRHTTFEIDGKPFVVDSPPKVQTLSPGTHRVVVKDESGKVLEQRSIDVAASGVLNAFGQHAYVYNAGGARVYQRMELTYAASESQRGATQAFQGGEPFFEVNGVDYLFVTPPDTVELSSTGTPEKKIAFLTVPNATMTDIGMMHLNENKLAEAEADFRKAAAIEPCTTRAREALAYLQERRGAAEEAAGMAKNWIKQCPDSVDPHRLYQEIEKNRGQRDRVIAEYRALAESHPQSARYRYLYGRLLGPAEELVHQREAVRLDAKAPWPHRAIAYHQLAEGAFDEAMDEMNAAVSLGLDDQATTSYLIYAAIAAGRAEELAPRLPAWKERHDTNAQWMLALARKDWTAAGALYETAKNDGAGEGALWYMRAKILELSGAEAELEQHIASGKAKQEIANVATMMSIDRAFVRGDLAGAVQQIDAAHDQLSAASPLYPLYGAAALMLQGDVAGGTRRADDILKTLDKSELHVSAKQQMTAYANALTGRASDDAVLAAVRETDVAEMKHAYFFLAARAAGMKQRERARELFRKSAAMSFDLSFPLLAARRLGA